MKTKIITIFLCFCVTTSFGQEKKTDSINFNKNEIKLNAGYLLGEIFEISYERNLTSQTSIGVTFFKPFKNNLNYNFMFNPYYKVFFGKKPAQGFYIEANSAFASLSKLKYTTNYDDYYIYTSKDEGEFAFGLGIAAGGKFVLNDQFVVDLYAGLGRFFNSIVHEAYPRFGINLGYRF